MAQLADGTQVKLLSRALTRQLQYSADKKAFTENILHFTVGGTADIDTLSEKLVTMGYVREDMVEGCGQFSVRGGIVDIFGAGSENPVRIEFFDDEVDSIRTFDAGEQRSIDKLERVTVYPCREILFDTAEKRS